MVGSTAATAPLRPARPAKAARWAAGSMVVYTSPPRCCLRVISFHSGTESSRGSVPASSGSSVPSSSVEPYVCEAKPVTGA